MAAVSLLFVVAVAGFLLFAAVIAVVLVIVLRQPGSRVNDPRHPSPYSTPLDRAKTAALELTSAEWEDFRRWVEGPRTPSAGQGEGITPNRE
jgi:hypothetical protein